MKLKQQNKSDVFTQTGRFVTLGENTWDLRSRHTFDKVHIDMNDVYSDVDSESEELIVDDDMSDDEYDEERNNDSDSYDDDEEELDIDSADNESDDYEY